METSEFSLAALIDAVRAKVSGENGSDSVDLTTLIDSTLPNRIVADQQQIETILQQLAAAASRISGCRHLRLTVHHGSDGRSELDITFEFQPEAGSRAANEPSNSNASIDHQLTPLKKLAEALGGEIGVHVQPAPGPLIWCRIPVQLAERQRHLTERSSSATERSDIKHPLRILMAEDNAINQRVGKLILQRAGYAIDLVNDGSEALEAHRGSPYDLILMDCQMPTMDGFEATHHIRAGGPRQPIIIAVTANALVGERERCLAAGMDDYLSKPFQAEQLVSLVEKWAAESFRRG